MKFSTKKLSSVILSVAILLSLCTVPALAENEAIDMHTDIITDVESTTEENIIDEKLMLHNENALHEKQDENESDNEMSEDVSEETEVLKNPMAQTEEFDYLNHENNTVTLMAANTNQYSISGTVSAPSGITFTENTTVYVYAYSAVKNGNEVLSTTRNIIAKTSVTIKAGQTSANYTLSVPSGNYIVGASCLNSPAYSGTNILSSNISYYIASGTTKSLYAADEIIVSGRNVSGKNIALNTAERYISGTITLDMVASEDTTMYISANKCGDYSEIGGNINIVIPKGKKSADYKIGVGKGAYTIYVNCNNNSGYFDGSGISDDYEKRISLNTEKKSISNVDISYNDTTTTKDVQITLNLSKSYATDRQYEIALGNDSNHWVSSRWITVPAGEKSISTNLSYDPNEYSNIYIEYTDVTGTDSLSSNVNKYYYSKEYGIVASSKMATILDKTTTSVVIQEPINNYSVSGMINVSSTSSIDRYVYVMATFNNKEIFYTRQKITNNTLASDYTINIPKRLQGETFTVSYGFSSDSCTVENPTLFNESLSLTGNITNIDFTISSSQINTKTFTGKITLPNAAPKDGVLIEIRDRAEYSNKKYYYISEGKTSIDYSIDNIIEEEGEYSLTTKVYDNCPTSIAKSRTITAFSEDVSGNVINSDIAFLSSVKLTGRISVPSGVTLNNYVSFYLYASLYNDEEHCYTTSYYTLYANDTYLDYTLYVPQNSTLRYIYIDDIADLSDKLYTGLMYYSESGLSLEDVTLNYQINSNRSGMDFELMEGLAISGTINMPDGGYFTNYGSSRTPITIYAQNIDTYQRFYQSIYNISDSTEYKIVLPKTYTGQYKIYYSFPWNYMGYTTNLVTNQDYYYSDYGMVTDSSLAKNIDVNESISGLNITLVKGNLISGKIQIPQNTYMSGNVKIRLGAVNNNNTYYTTLEITESDAGTDVPYSIPVPPDMNGEYYVYYSTSMDSGIESNIVNNTTYYYTINGITQDRDSRTPINVNSNIDGINMELQTGIVISGKVLLPVGGYVNERVPVSIYAHSDNGNSYSASNVYIDDNSAKYSLCIPKENAAKYYVSYRIYSGYNTNILADTVYYANNNYVKEVANAEWFSQSEDKDINLILPIGRLVTGKILLPDDAFMEYTPSADMYINGTSYDMNIDKKYNYSCTVPDDLEGNYMIAIKFDYLGKSNIISDSYNYYTEDGKCAHSSVEATPVQFTAGENISDINIAVETGICISGKISMPSNANNTYSESYTIGLLDTPYNTTEYVQDSSGYYFIVPKTYSSGIVYLKASYSWEEDDNLDRTSTVYYNSSGTVYDVEDAEIISFENSKIEDIDITIPIYKAKINIQGTRPNTYEGSFGVDLYADFGDYVLNVSDGLYSNQDEINTSFGVRNNVKNNTFWLYYEVDNEDYRDYGDLVTNRVYVNTDGTLVVDRLNAQKHTLSEDTNIDFTFALYDMLSDDMEFESDHPYDTTGDDIYTYIYPEDVTCMWVSFSEATYVNANDFIILYDQNNIQIGEDYTVDELAGKVVKVDGNVLKIRIKPTSGKNGYGFAINKVIGYAEKEEGLITVVQPPINQDDKLLNAEHISDTQSVSLSFMSGLSDPVDGKLMFVSYMDNALVEMYSQDISIAPELNELNDITLDWQGKPCDSIKMFIWDSLDGMVPLMMSYHCN